MLEYIKINNQIITDFKIIKHYSEEVKLIVYKNTKYILKKIILPITMKQELGKIAYIDFLYQNGIKVSRVLECFVDNNIFYEIQEYVEENKKIISAVELMTLLANYHKVSKLYTNADFNNSVYNVESFCRGIKLDKILLGFEDKYYNYPLKNYEKNRMLISNDLAPILDNLVEIYKTAFDQFVMYYLNYQCISHNDFTPNNYISTLTDTYLIDFDFAITTSPYVDVIDAIVHRNQDFNQIILEFSSFKNKIQSLIDEYNNINNVLDINGILLMFIIKVVGFNLYINLNETNIQIINSQIKTLYNVILKINDEIIYK